MSADVSHLGAKWERMKAVIMAGGEGTRLRPLTYNQPKPMIPMANRALMEHVVDLLRRHGFTDIVVTVGFQANAIQNYFGNGAEFGARMVYASEEAPLGTAGSVRNAMQQLDEPFLVISGDVLTDIDLSAVVDFHTEKKAVATIALRSVPNPLEFGIVMTRRRRRRWSGSSRNPHGARSSRTPSTPAYMSSSQGSSISSARAWWTFPPTFSRAWPPTGHLLYGCVTEGYWEDIGTLEAYARAHQDILDGRVDVELPGFLLARGHLAGRRRRGRPSRRRRGPGHNRGLLPGRGGCHAWASTRCSAATSGSGADAYLERAVVHDNAYLGPGVRLAGLHRRSQQRPAPGRPGRRGGGARRRMLHRRARRRARRGEGLPVQDGRARRRSSTRRSSGSRGARATCSAATGVSGLANVDITPELAVRLAMAFATRMPRGATVAVSRDTSRAARVLKQSVVRGPQCRRASTSPTSKWRPSRHPFRRAQRAQRRRGNRAPGLTTPSPSRSASSTPERHRYRRGAQRKIERIFYREDFRRCLASETGDVAYPMRVPDLYAQALLAKSTSEPSGRPGSRWSWITPTGRRRL